MFKRERNNQLNQIAALAAMAGLRSMSAPALLSSYLQKHRSRRLGHSNLGFMQSGKAVSLLRLLAAAEMLGDKLPSTPKRIRPASLLGRGLSGALIGATMARTGRKRKYGGAGLGFLSAVTGTYASYLLRKKLAKKTFIPDIMWGILEDILVVRAGKRLLQR